MPTLVVGFYGVFVQDVMLVIYAGAWFFGGYIVFAIYENGRQYLDQRRKR